jgi:c(7)-type cytochrome triheme protein
MNAEFRSASRRRLALTGIICCCAFFAYAFLLIPRPNAFAAPVDEVVNEPLAQDYSRFKHTSAQHARLPCLLCHKREDNSARMKLPGHIPCSSCHVEQFASNTSPLCNICHTPTSVKPFPGLKSFTSRFDHGRHLRLTNCATCHKPARRGVSLSVPSGSAAHTTCFQCHGPQTVSGGKNIGSCGTCHQSGRPVRNSDWARAFAVNFSHSEHIATKKFSCTDCHTVRAGSAKGRQVSSPLVSMHFAPARAQSCGACHNDRRAFGGNDFSDCRRCHEGNSFRFR